MKCKVCGGAGVIQGQAPGLVSCCPACDGKGFIELTNEEWLCSLSTKEKAKWLDGLIAYCIGVGHITETEQKKYQHIVADVEVWLKQPHKEE